MNKLPAWIADAKLTEDQLKVVFSEHPRFVVQAGAGSGKTGVLVWRYLKHVIEDEFSPDEILTITFTRLAAANMRRRIVDRLLSSGMYDAARLAETGPIDTIHAFLQRILKSHSLEAKLDPDFTLIDTDRALSNLQKSFQTVVSSDITDDPAIRKFLNKMSGEQKWGANASMQSKLFDLVNSGLGKLRGSLIKPSELAKIYDSPSSLARKFLSEDSQYPATQDYVWQQIQAIADGHIVASASPVGKWLEANCGYVQLMLKVWEELDQMQGAAHELDFTDLESKSIALLESSEITRERLRKQFKSILVDEAQDLNPVQYRLIELLSPKLLMMVGDPKQSIYGFRGSDLSLFESECRQYPVIELTVNFRSDNAILGSVDSVFEQAFGPDYSPMDRKPGVEAGDFSLWEFRASASGSFAARLSEQIQQKVSEGIQCKDIAVLVDSEKSGSAIGDELTKLGVRNEVMGRRNFYGLMAIRDLANLLHALTRPDSEFKMMCVLRGPVVQISLDGILQIHQTKKALECSVLEAIVKTEYQIPEDRKKADAFLIWFEPMSRRADRYSAWEMISKVFAETRFLEEAARDTEPERVLANVRKLFKMAASDPLIRPWEFVEYVNTIHNLQSKEEQPAITDDADDAIRIMTYHKSKGLEFPVVILVPKNSKDFSPSEPFFDAKTGLIVISDNMSDDKKRKADQGIISEIKAKDDAEKQRLLYVGMTRAIKELILVVPEKQPQSIWMNLINMNLRRKDGFTINVIQ